jgi:CDP-diglyceride synthetase
MIDNEYPMKLEGEYAVDGRQRAHRAASGIVYAVWIGLTFYRSGVGEAFKTAAYFLLPISCIWFSESMASYTGVMWGKGRLIGERSHPTFLRWGGWFLLLVPLFLMLMAIVRR